MSLIQKLKDDSVQALKNRDKVKRKVLSTLIGLVEQKAPNVIEGGKKTHSDEQVIGVIKTIMAGNLETKNQEEDVYYAPYIPTKMSDDKLYNIVKSYIIDNELSGMKDMRKLMDHLKTNHSGTYDGKVASDIAKSML
jgi:uncharacterized protein YqeY